MSSADALGPLHQSIAAKLSARFHPSVLEITNDSHKHAHHAAMRGTTSQETHFSVKVVSDAFKGQKTMARHRAVYGVLAEEFKTGLHALALDTKTPEEDV